MIGSYFIDNGKLKSVAEAVIPIDNLYFSYGYGVYETLKVRSGILFFPELHVSRLLNSAQIIGLKIPYTSVQILEYLEKLRQENNIRDANIKMLFIGGDQKTESHLFTFCLNPLFLPDKFYKDGVKVITYFGERIFPHAKTLNMLQSVLAYQKAKEENAYDALLVNKQRVITEGTRTNLFFTDGKNIFMPPTEQALEGVTKSTLLRVCKQMNYNVQEKTLFLKDLHKYQGYFLTSTSSKVLPIRKINDTIFKIPQIVREIMKAYNRFLINYEQERKS